MKKINFIVLVALAGVLASCGVGVYYPHAHNLFGAQTTVQLNQANFRVVRDVEAVVEVVNTNLSRSAVEKSAYGQLLRNARLTGSQVLINVVIEEIIRDAGNKTAQYVAARATIIEFLDENGNPTISEPYRPQSAAKPASTVTPQQNATEVTPVKEELSVTPRSDNHRKSNNGARLTDGYKKEVLDQTILVQSIYKEKKLTNTIISQSYMKAASYLMQSTKYADWDLLERINHFMEELSQKYHTIDVEGLENNLQRASLPNDIVQIFEAFLER